MKCSICYLDTDKCFCQLFWKTFEKDILELKTFSLQHQKCTIASFLKISTMTVSFKLGTGLILKKLVESFERKGSLRQISYKQGTKKSDNKDLNYEFYNQATLRMAIRDKVSTFGEQVSNISVMLFPNGSANAVGCKTVRTCARMIKDIISFLEQNKDGLTSPKTLKPTGVRICMIKSDLSINRRLKQKRFSDYLFNNHGIETGGRVRSTIFDPDKYPGIKVKYLTQEPTTDDTKMEYTRKGRKKIPGEVSILIFRTGKMSITGAKSANEIVRAYHFITTLFFKDSAECLL